MGHIQMRPRLAFFLLGTGYQPAIDTYAEVLQQTPMLGQLVCQGFISDGLKDNIETINCRLQGSRRLHLFTSSLIWVGIVEHRSC
jgi:hypothetical protein